MSVRGFTTLVHNTGSSLPVRRSAAALGAAVALAAGTVTLVSASSADAATAARTSANGTASAVVLRTGLDVSLLNNAANVPLNVTVNDVHAPADAHRTLLTAKLNGVDNGRSFSVLRADVATAHATADAHKSQGYANLARASVQLPGLPASTGLINVEAVTSTATCAVGEQPTAHITMAGNITVLGKKVSVTTRGTTRVDVPGEGMVSLELAKRTTTSSTAAATALQLNVAVTPAQLNVATIKGSVTLAQATCQTPGTTPGGSGTAGSSSAGSSSAGSSTGTSGTAGSTSGVSSGGGSATAGSSSAGSATAGSGTQTQAGSGTSTQNLAETGSSSSTPYVAGAAAVLVAAGGGVLYTSRRRKARG